MTEVVQIEIDMSDALAEYHAALDAEKSRLDSEFEAEIADLGEDVQAIRRAIRDKMLQSIANDWEQIWLSGGPT